MRRIQTSPQDRLPDLSDPPPHDSGVICRVVSSITTSQDPSRHASAPPLALPACSLILTSLPTSLLPLLHPHPHLVRNSKGALEGVCHEVGLVLAVVDFAVMQKGEEDGVDCRIEHSNESSCCIPSRKLVRQEEEEEEEGEEELVRQEEGEGEDKMIRVIHTKT
eukprot:768465-Hanusia_phi.AAC.1